MNGKEAFEIIKLLRKQNAILADISKKLDRLSEAEDKKAKDEEIREKVKQAMESCDIPDLLDNEKTLETCHVISHGVRYTFSHGRLVEKKDANQMDYYLYRRAD